MIDLRTTVAAAALGVLLAQAPAPQPAPTFRSGVDLVQIDAHVSDKSGAPVLDFRPEEFTVTVDGKPRRVNSLSMVMHDAGASAPAGMGGAGGLPPEAEFDTSDAATSNVGAAQGRLIVLVVDQGNITKGGGKGAMEAASRFLDRLTPADKVGVVTIPIGPRVEVTNDRRPVRDALARILGGGANAYQGWTSVSLAEAYAFVTGTRAELWRRAKEEECNLRTQDEVDRCVQSMEREARQKVEAAHSATRAAVMSLETLLRNLTPIDGQKYIVLVSQGLVTGSMFAYMEGRRDLDQLAPLASRARATFFVLQFARSFLESVDVNEVFMTRTASEDAGLLADGLGELVGQTGGTMYRLMTASDASFTRIARETSASYELTIETEAADRNGKPHDIRVASSRPGVTIRARRQFLIDAPAAPEPVERRLRHAIESPFLPAAVPVDLSSYVIGQPGSSEVRVLLAAEMGCGTQPLAPFSVAFSVSRQNGVLVGGSLASVDSLVARRRGERCGYHTAEVSLEPGDYVVRFVVADRDGHIGGVEHPVSARLIQVAPYEISSLLVADPQAALPGQVRLLVGRESGMRRVALHVEVSQQHTEAPGQAQAAGGAPAVEFALLRAGQARPISVASPAVAPNGGAGRWVAEGTIQIDGLAAGTYTLRATVLADGRAVGAATRALRVGESSGPR